MCYISNMHTYLPYSILYFLQRYCIIKILCVGRINSKCCYFPKVTSRTYILFTYLPVNLFGSHFHLPVELIWQFKFGQYRMHLCLIFARHTQQLYYLCHRVFLSLVPFYNSRHCFHPLFSTLQLIFRYKKVEGHTLVIRYKE